MALHKALLFSAVLALAWAQDEEPLTDEEKMKKKHDEVASHPYCMEDNCYELLGVKKDAGGLPIKRAYRKLASEWHPDKNPDPRAKTLFQKYANAYEVLSSPQASLARPTLAPTLTLTLTLALALTLTLTLTVTLTLTLNLDARELRLPARPPVRVPRPLHALQPRLVHAQERPALRHAAHRAHPLRDAGPPAAPARRTRPPRTHTRTALVVS